MPLQNFKGSLMWVMLQVLTEMLTIRTSYWTRKIQNFKERKDWNNFLIESFKIVSSLYEMIHHVVHVTQVQAQVHVVSTFPPTTCSHKNPPRNRHAQTDNHMDARMHLLSHSHNTWKTSRQAKRLTARQTNRFLKKGFLQMKDLLLLEQEVSVPVKVPLHRQIRSSGPWRKDPSLQVYFTLYSHTTDQEYFPLISDPWATLIIITTTITKSTSSSTTTWKVDYFPWTATW